MEAEPITWIMVKIQGLPLWSWKFKVVSQNLCNEELEIKVLFLNFLNFFQKSETYLGSL